MTVTQNNLFNIYVINLEKDADRLKSLQAQFPKYYEKFNIIRAVDGKGLDTKTYFNYLSEYYLRTKKVISPAELGCSLSHIKTLEAFLETEKKYALVLEDDVIGSDQGIDLVLEICSELSEGVFINLIAQNQYTASRWIYGKKSKINNVYQLAQFSYFFLFSNCAYLVTRQVAEYVVSKHYQNIALADEYEFLFKKSATNVCFNPIFEHPVDLKFSNIEPERAIFRPHTILQKIFSLAFHKRLAQYLLISLKILFLFLLGYRKIKTSVYPKRLETKN